VKVLVLAALSPAQLDEIRAVDPSLEVTGAYELFAPEIAREWPQHAVNWYLPPRFQNQPDDPDSAAKRNALLAEAEAICISFPFPRRLVTRAPKLRLIHKLTAGVSNLRESDLWRSGVPTSVSRGHGNVLAIAEWAMAAMLAFAKELPRAVHQGAAGGFDRASFKGIQLAGKTLGIVGVGGIGMELARLASAFGMRVIGTRRSGAAVEGVEVRPATELHSVLRESDVLVLAAQSTDESHHLIDAAAFEQMKPGTILINVARGELIDEGALTAALEAGKLRGFAADVYEREFEVPPPAELLAMQNVVLTPHTSGQTETPSTKGVELFRTNLRHLLAGEPLEMLIDWERGY
jgi:phosphoglycerate dehydrogenase-like enzyme